MDRDQHERFLEYLERFEYFGRGDAVRLGKDEFEIVDTEHRRLAALDRRDADEEERFQALRAVLLKD